MTPEIIVKNEMTYFQGLVPVKAIRALRSAASWDEYISNPTGMKIADVPLEEEVTREEAIMMAHSPAPMGTKLRPYRNKVLLLFVDAETQIGSIIVPGVAQVPTGEAIVIDVGEGDWDPATQKFIPIPDLKVGDRVHIAKYTGSHITLREEMIDPETQEKVVVSRTYYTLDPKHILNKYE